MADDNVLEIIARFVLDKSSQKEVQNAIAGVGAGTGAGTSAIVQPSADFRQTWAAVNDYSKSFGVNTQQAAASLAGMATVGQKTEAQILADVGAMEALGTQSSATATAVQNVDRNAEQMTNTFRRGSAVVGGFMLARAGQYLTQIGQAILTTPIQDYVKYAGMASGASAEWLTSQKELQQATIRIGGVLARDVAPAMSTIAGVVNDIASLFEKYPALGTGTVALAGTVAVGGTVLKTLGEIMTMLAAIKMAGGFAGIFGLGGAAATGAGAAAINASGGVGAAAYGPAAAGLGAGVASMITAVLPYILVAGVIAAIATAVYSWISNTDFGKSRNMQAAPAQAVATVAYAGFSVLDKITGLDLAEKRFLQVSDALGLLGDKAGQTADQIKAASGEMVPQAAVDAFIAYKEQENAAALQYEQQRVQIIQDYGKQTVEAEQGYQADRLKIIESYKTSLGDEAANYARQTATAARNYYQQETNSEQDYYKQRTKAAASYSLDVQRNEEDHQRRLLQMQQDHAQKVEDLLDKNDAFGLLNEMRGYEKNRSQVESDYAIESSRRSQDFAIRIAEMEGNFADERARRTADYAQQRADAQTEYNLRAAQRAEQLQSQLKELDTNHKTEMIKLAANETDKLNTLQSNYNDERTKTRQELGKQLSDLGVYMGAETTLRDQYYKDWTAQFIAFRNSILGSTNYNDVGTNRTGRASGGYVGAGTYKVGEEGYEYVLNHKTTSMLEKLAGNKLDQNKITALLSGGQGNQQVVYNDNRRIDGRVSAADRAALRNDNIRWFREALA